MQNTSESIQPLQELHRKSAYTSRDYHAPSHANPYDSSIASAAYGRSWLRKSDQLGVPEWMVLTLIFVRCGGSPKASRSNKLSERFCLLLLFVPSFRIMWFVRMLRSRKWDFKSYFPNLDGCKRQSSDLPPMLRRDALRKISTRLWTRQKTR